MSGANKSITAIEMIDSIIDQNKEMVANFWFSALKTSESLLEIQRLSLTEGAESDSSLVDQVRSTIKRAGLYNVEFRLRELESKVKATFSPDRINTYISDLKNYLSKTLEIEGADLEIFEERFQKLQQSALERQDFLATQPASRAVSPRLSCLWHSEMLYPKSDTDTDEDDEEFQP